MNQESIAEPELTCPNCGTKIKLTESLAAPLVEATEKRYRELLAAKDVENEKREVQLKEKEYALDKRELDVDALVDAKLKAAQAKLVADAKRTAEREVKEELDKKARENADLEAVIAAKEAKLAEAQQAQTEALQAKRKYEDAQKEINLTVEKQVNDQLQVAKAEAAQSVEARMTLKLAESEQTIEGMKNTIDDLKRKAEQGSQQLQGEVQELRLEELFSAKFPQDLIEPVAKGERGADILHRINDPLGNFCGAILWESKRTKNWSPSWLPKLREDQRDAKADVAVIISQVLPKEIDTFDLMDDVWVVSPRVVLPFALMLRRALVDLGVARQAKEGQQTKMGMVYRYLTGPNFKLRVQAIVEAFSTMQEDLAKERKAIAKQWSKRDAQLQNAMLATVGMKLRIAL